MGHNHLKQLVVMRVGIILALLTLLFGFGLGGVFGAFEDRVKSHLKSEGQAVLDIVYNGDYEAMKKVTSKSWVYFKRAHLHANGLGTTSLVLILFLMFYPASDKLKKLAAVFLGGGSLGYSLFWLLAGLRAPGLGGTHAAKESLKWLALPASGACILGVIAALVLSIMFLKKVKIQ